MQNNNILHTIPLGIEKYGTFEYVKDEHTRKMLVNCWQAITLIEMWDFLKNYPVHIPIMFTKNREINKIINKMNELPNSIGHSGFSIAWTLREMQYIAIYGEEEYNKIYENK